MPNLSFDIAVQRDGFDLRARLDLPLDGITALFGPSGSGKTTLLRVIAGLEPAPAGFVTYDGTEWQNAARTVPAHERRVGFVFQDGRLFSHLTVEQNLRFALVRAGARRIALDDVIAALDLRPLLGRRPVSLSGGEQQRVAIGRALVGSPRLLLMDEPLSSLDLARKREIVPYIEKLPQEFALPVLYVTHNLDEVARLASRVLLLARGRIVAYGDVAEILERVDLATLTGERETGAVLRARLIAHRAGIAELSLGSQAMFVPMSEAPGDPELRVRVRSSDVAIATERPRGLSIRNVLGAAILAIEPGSGPHAEILLDVDGQHLRARITRDALHELQLEVGRPVFALVKSVALESTLLG